MGELIQLNRRHAGPMLLTKKQFSRHSAIRRSTRWVEQRVNEGLPSHMEGNRRMFPLEEGLAWIRDWKQERGAA